MSGPRPPRTRRRTAKAPPREAPGERTPRPLPATVRRARPRSAAPQARPNVIRVRGARTHNLAGIDVDLPRDRLVVITGPSGSGKSSLAFDTIYAEGRRRYLESLQVSARALLDRLPRPDVDLVDGLSPCVALEQNAAGRTPRSTLGTITEVYDFLRLLFARLGTVYDPATGAPARRTTREDIVAAVLALPERSRVSVVAPVVEDEPGDHAALLADLLRRGFVRVALDGTVTDLSTAPSLDPDQPHTIEVYVDRLVVRPGIEGRLREAVATAADLGGGVVRIVPLDGEERTFREHFDLGGGGRLEQVSPALFSFNHPRGACPACGGLGTRASVLAERIVPDPSRTLDERAILPHAPHLRRALARRVDAVVRALEIPRSVPFRDLPAEARIALLEGTGDPPPPGLARPFPGLVAEIRDRLDRARADADEGDELAEELERLAEDRTCPSCDGTRLRPEALAVRLADRTIAEVAALPVGGVRAFLEALEVPAADADVACVVVEPALERLRFLEEIGLGYLSLDRAATTLSGGEFQRARLATQVGAGLVGVTYVLDEPSIGLHPRDTGRLIGVLERLRDLGNTVIVVEHDVDTIRAADVVVDMGPGAGRAGGRVLAQGPVEAVEADPDSITGAYLSGRTPLPPLPERRRGRGRLILEGARGHNLADVTLEVPLGTLTCVSGVSGSGKSSLVVDTLLRAAAAELAGAAKEPLPFRRLRGLAALEKVVHVDQAPIGRTPRSTPATYTGIFTELRALFAQLPTARVRGLTPADFSFNTGRGRCEVCAGEGVRRIAMQFLPDVTAPCPACGGARYGPQVLEVLYRGRTIAEILAMTVDEALDLFVAQPRIRERLCVLAEVGLGYLTLGQSATTLSGGEAQRMKLARELARRTAGPTLYVLDEPTTGLHVADIVVLLRVFDRLVEAGHTVLVIEHDPVVLRHADHIVDLGPGAGPEGGRIVVAGTPEAVAACPDSHTGRHLAPWLEL